MKAPLVWGRLEDYCKEPASHKIRVIVVCYPYLMAGHLILEVHL